jgi:diaminohydroxyphosphoribosylaminopyrimidine deaminase/5-amino-6-(5-phosphoribosylamino)uracil reductase
MSTPSSIDPQTMADFWMVEALRLAHEGSGALAHPNPRVGAVLVRDGKKVGEGYHVYEKLDHAEIVALREAGARARGASLYINLEPCCTTGRTGPCTKAIIAAGVSHVYAAMLDPNPAVAGRGFAELRRAGIEVFVGNFEAEAKRLNEDFVKWIKTGEPFVTLKSAMTLDAKIATPGGKTATAITGPAAHEAVHRLFRHSADALLTGIGTVLADDPMLNDRSGEPRRRPLLRVVLDSKLRLPLKSKIVTSAKGDVAVFTAQSVESRRARALVRAGVELVRLPQQGGHVDLRAALRELAKRQCLHVLIEAGAELNGAALTADVVDKLALFCAPMFIGEDGVPMASLPSKKAVSLASLKNLSVNLFEPDILIEGYFRDVYRNHRTRRKN